MARPRTGNPRNIVVNVRLTASEAEALTDRYGTAGKGVRAAVVSFLAGSTSRAPAGREKGAEKVGTVVPISELADAQERHPAGKKREPNPPAKTPASSSDARHLHRPQGDPVKTTYENGHQVNWYLCECGQEMKR